VKVENSSTIDEVDFDGLGVLTVKFRTGATYRYNDVPPVVANQVMGALSVGGALNELVKKQGYAYTRIS
jgi:hypothetical protein